MPPEERRLKEPESYFDKNKNEKEGDGDVDNSRLTSCGIGAWRPAWLQKFASPVYFMWVMGMVGIIQGKQITEKGKVLEYIYQFTTLCLLQE